MTLLLVLVSVTIMVWLVWSFWSAFTDDSSGPSAPLSARQWFARIVGGPVVGLIAALVAQGLQAGTR